MRGTSSGFEAGVQIMELYDVYFLVLHSCYVRECSFLEMRPDVFRGEGGREAERGGQGEHMHRPGESGDKYMQI